MSDDVSDLLQAVGLNNQKIVERSAAAQELADRQAQAGKDAEAALFKGTDADKIIASAKMLATQKSEQQAADMATKMGTNPDASSSIMDKLADDWRSSSINAMDKQQKLDHDLSINFFDHPIDYIGAQIGMEGTVKRADAAVNHRNSTAQALQEAQSLTQGAVAQTKALERTVTSATMQATFDKVDANLQGQRSALAIQNAGIQMDSLKALDSMDATQISNLSAGIQARNQQAQLGIAQQHLKLATQQAEQNKIEFQQHVEEFNQRVADKAATKADMDFYATTVQKGAAAMGVDLTGLGSTKIFSLFSNKAAGFSDYFNVGLRATTDGAATISDNAGETARIIADRNAPLRPEQAVIKKLFLNSTTKAASPQGAQGLGYDPTKKDQVFNGAGKYANMEAVKMQKNIDPTDGTNIYAAPPLEAVMQVPGLQKTPWYQSVMKDQMAAGGLKEFNPEQLTSLTVAAIQSGKISFNQAAEGLQTAHAAAARLNNATKNYKGFGLPEQKSYNISVPNAFGIMRQYDLTTPQGVQQMLSAKMNADKVYRMDVNDNPLRN